MQAAQPTAGLLAAKLRRNAGRQDRRCSLFFVLRFGVTTIDEKSASRNCQPLEFRSYLCERVPSESTLSRIGLRQADIITTAKCATPRHAQSLIIMWQ